MDDALSTCALDPFSIRNNTCPFPRTQVCRLAPVLPGTWPLQVNRKFSTGDFVHLKVSTTLAISFSLSFFPFGSQVTVGSSLVIPSFLLHFCPFPPLLSVQSLLPFSLSSHFSSRLTVSPFSSCSHHLLLPLHLSFQSTLHFPLLLSLISAHCSPFPSLPFHLPLPPQLTPPRRDFNNSTSSPPNVQGMT